VKLGSAESATFIRNVPDPERQRPIRDRKAGGRASGGTSPV
jgi:hypothetical protein